jgi:hypothetical protein
LLLFVANIDRCGAARQTALSLRVQYRGMLELTVFGTFQTPMFALVASAAFFCSCSDVFYAPQQVSPE